MDLIESAAIAVSNDKKRLFKYLMEARYDLIKSLRLKFNNARYDFNNKRLIGDGYILQWQLRSDPTQPESYRNQQTSKGNIVLIRN